MEEKNKKSAAAREAFDWVESVVLALVVVVLVFTFLFRITTVDGSSMLPTLVNEDRLIISKLFYTPNYNDVIILKAKDLMNENGEYGKPLVKRVVGLPGDTISVDFEEGYVYRNNEKLEVTIEDGVILEDGHAINTLTNRQEDMTEPMTVPEGYVFVMGDNRNNSLDSRSGSVGFVDQNYIIGKALIRIFPFNTFGTFK